MSRLLQIGEGKDFDDTANDVNFITVKAVPKAMSAEETDEEMKELRRAIQTRKWEGVKCSEYLEKNLRATVLTIGHCEYETATAYKGVVAKVREGRGEVC